MRPPWPHVSPAIGVGDGWVDEVQVIADDADDALLIFLFRFVFIFLIH